VRDLATHSGGFDNSKPYMVADHARMFEELYRKRPVWPRGERFPKAYYDLQFSPSFDRGGGYRRSSRPLADERRLLGNLERRRAGAD